MSTITRKIVVAVLSFLMFLVASTNLNMRAYITEINITGKTIIIDISKSPIHTEFANFDGNLTDALNTVNIEAINLESPINADALIIAQPQSNYSTLEMTNIMNFLSSGNKTLFIGGDADYGGNYNATYANDLLAFLGSKIRLDSSQITDSVYNDGMDYRVAAKDYGGGIIGTNVSTGCNAGIIMHGTCAILGFEDSNLIDLRATAIDGIEILLSFSENSTAGDSDGSDNEYDLYSKDVPEDTGNYPAVACETLLLGGKKSYIVLTGELIFSDYKKMYDQYTEAGTYNGGIHYGQMFVNNMLNYFLDFSNYIVIEEFSKMYIVSLFTMIPIVVCLASIRKRKNTL
jgi:hypothetical protein